MVVGLYWREGEAGGEMTESWDEWLRWECGVGTINAFGGIETVAMGVEVVEDILASGGGAEGATGECRRQLKSVQQERRW